jgi:hypothetical protein
MNAVASRNVAKSLESIGEFVSANATRAPVDFVRELARCWKDKGGYLAGKPRHSDRYLDELLKVRGTPVRSLTPKLAGRTNLRAADANVLVSLFLSHWRYKGDPTSGEIKVPTSDMYDPLLSDAEIEDVSEYMAARITAGESETAPASGPVQHGQRSFELIVKEFRESAALISAATGSPVLSTEGTALIGFRDLMDGLWAAELADKQPRILIWTVDLGRQVFEDPEARRRFMHVQSLITRFKALRQFSESVTEERWKWLQSRVAIVLDDRRANRPDVPRLPSFDPHHVLFSAIPTEWGGSRPFIDLYGTAPAQGTYSIFLKRQERSPERTKRPDQVSAAGQSYTLRYFGHALMKADENGEFEMRGLRLESPGWSYVEALGTVFIAANQILDLLPMPSEQYFDDQLKINPAHAIEKLRHHGFRLLRLDEFMKF